MEKPRILIRDVPPADFNFSFRRDSHGRVIDFTDPTGDTYVLDEGEEIVFIQSGDGKEKKVFIKLVDGTEVPFEEWSQDKIPN